MPFWERIYDAQGQHAHTTVWLKCVNCLIGWSTAASQRLIISKTMIFWNLGNWILLKILWFLSWSTEALYVRLGTIRTAIKWVTNLYYSRWYLPGSYCFIIIPWTSAPEKKKIYITIFERKTRNFLITFVIIFHLIYKESANCKHKKEIAQFETKK